MSSLNHRVNYSTLDQCSSTLLDMVHPKKSCDELMHSMPKIWYEAKHNIKSNLRKTISLQSALRITQGRAHNKFKKLSLMFFCCCILSSNIPNWRLKSFLIAPLINESMGVIEFLLRDLTSHKQEKPLSHKYVVAVVGIWMRTEIPFFAMLLYSGTFIVVAPKIQYMVSLYIMLPCKNLIEDQLLNLRFSVVILS